MKNIFRNLQKKQKTQSERDMVNAMFKTFSVEQYERSLEDGRPISRAVYNSIYNWKVCTDHHCAMNAICSFR